MAQYSANCEGDSKFYLLGSHGMNPSIKISWVHEICPKHLVITSTDTRIYFWSSKYCCNSRWWVSEFRNTFPVDLFSDMFWISVAGDPQLKCANIRRTICSEEFYRFWHKMGPIGFLPNVCCSYVPKTRRNKLLRNYTKLFPHELDVSPFS